MKCRICCYELEYEFVDLVASPPSNSYLNDSQLSEPEVYYPLRLFVCHHCFLVQIDEFKKNSDIFNEEYAYFSSISNSWLKHAKDYVDLMTAKLKLGDQSFVVEIASNDGYLLQYFVKKQVPCLGIEPTINTAEKARQKEIPVITEFFGSSLAAQIASEGKCADLLLGNNVLAHVPDVHDFIMGLKILLKPTGTITMEFPHLAQLVENNQFDTIYHEHFSYFSLSTVYSLFKSHGLKIYDVEELPTHGGSLRIFACHEENKEAIATERVAKLLAKEQRTGMLDLSYYSGFQSKVDALKNEFLAFLIDQYKQGKSVAGYGAAAKGNTLLNYCGVKPDLLAFICDAALSKQYKFSPGSHIPILPPEILYERKPDWVVIFPWNIAEEIKEIHRGISEWGGRFVTAIPTIKIH